MRARTCIPRPFTLSVLSCDIVSSAAAFIWAAFAFGGAHACPSAVLGVGCTSTFLVANTEVMCLRGIVRHCSLPVNSLLLSHPSAAWSQVLSLWATRLHPGALCFLVVECRAERQVVPSVPSSCRFATMRAVKAVVKGLGRMCEQCAIGVSVSAA